MVDMDLVFLISAPYSGATLFSILMNQHPEISSDGEMFPYIRGSEIVCGCGRLQVECKYYRAVAESMLNVDINKFNDNYFYYVPGYCKNYFLSRFFEGFLLNDFTNKVRDLVISLGPGIKRLEDKFANIHLDFYSKSLKRRNASVYFDGSKSLRRAELFAARKLTSKMIYLIRDGRAFCNSFIKNKQLPHRKLYIASKLWEKNIKKFDILQRRFPHIETIVVRYNDLCEAPGRELKRVWEFLGLKYDDKYLEYRKDDMHILGNRMLSDYKGVIKEDLSWRGRLKEEEIQQLNKLMNNKLKRFKFI